jgi:hypothetical protein
MNECTFSKCQKYRYTLDHDEGDLLTPCRDYIAWIGLNPSIADEDQLDPTLRRILSFTKRWGFHRFVMLNLFAVVSTDPKTMLAHPEPVGPLNDEHLLKSCAGASAVVCCWGDHGDHQGRAQRVLDLLRGVDLSCLGQTKGGLPRHPLYLPADTARQRFRAI